MADLQGKLLTTALKHGSIYAFDPAAIEGAGFTRYYLGQNRLRDIEIADGGRTIYMLTDSQGGVQNEDGDGADGLENPGAILVHTAGGADPAGSVASEGSAGAAADEATGSAEEHDHQPASDPEAAAQEAESGNAEGSPETAPEGGN